MQSLLDRLCEKKITWEEFQNKVNDPLTLARLKSSQGHRTLLHLAVIDGRLDLIELLKNEPLLKLRRDQYGLSPIDLATLLNRKEALSLLQPISNMASIPELPPMDSFEYLPQPIFETNCSLEDVINTVAKTKLEDKISSDKIWMGIYFDKEIRNGIHSPIQIRYVDSQIGFGVFAAQKISPCTFVGEYTGIIQQRTPKQLKEKNYCLRYPVWGGRKNFCIDAEGKGNFTRFLNHSSNPNLGLQSLYWRGIPRMIFIALKEIPEGSQLTFDYGPIFWKRHPQIPKEL